MVIDWVDRINPANQIPVFIVSSLPPEQYAERAKASGITTCFRKPVDKEKLHAAIAELFKEPPSAPAA
jgi:CheY-like chemotaxis protein